MDESTAVGLVLGLVTVQLLTATVGGNLLGRSWIRPRRSYSIAGWILVAIGAMCYIATMIIVMVAFIFS